MNCLYCGVTISDKAKYCSEAHRKAYVRRTKQGGQPGQNDPGPTRTLNFKPTRTDRLFEEHRPGYYNFSHRVFEKKCLLPECQKEFKTRLSLLKFCCPEHQIQVLNMLTN